MGSAILNIKTKRNDEPWLYRGCISFLLYIMFMDWFMPAGIGSHSEFTHSTVTMILLTAVLLFIGSLRISYKYRILLIAGCALLSLWWLLIPSSGETWFLNYIYTLQNDMRSWSNSGHFRYVSQETKAVVVIVGWTLFVTSVQLLAIQLRTVLLFGMVTVVYLLCMEMLNDVHSPGGMVRAICCFLLLQSLLQLPRLLGGEEPLVLEKKRYGIWAGIAALTVLVTLFLTTSFTAVIPVKSENDALTARILNSISSWTDATSDETARAVFASTGYDPGGGEMGAPLLQNNEVYFTATSPVPAYWRGQSRSVYDGRSWKQMGATNEGYEYISTQGRIREEEIEENTYFRIVQQTLTFQQPVMGGSDIFSGGVPLRLTFGNTAAADLPYIWSDRISGNLRFDDKQMNPPIQQYSIDALVPAEDLSILRKAEGEDPASIMEANLQLPVRIPARVTKLADSITKGTNTRYDTVMAVSEYLKSNYTYTLNTRIPEKGQDFVDDFLFITKKGYCSHFATAMVILLRSEGIPARYVQGFAPGERNDQHPDQYTVTQGDAHAWVEVYFPGAGWFPFEATPGYSTASAASTNTSDTSAEGGSFELSGFKHAMGEWTSAVQAWLAGVAQLRLLALAAAAMLLFAAAYAAGLAYGPALRLRLRIIYPRRAFPDRERLLHISAPVWDLLAQRYGKRESGHTLREYIAALPVADDAVREEVRRFAADWETIAYSSVVLSRGESIAFLQRCLRIAKSIYR